MDSLFYGLVRDEFKNDNGNMILQTSRHFHIFFNVEQQALNGSLSTAHLICQGIQLSPDPHFCALLWDCSETHEVCTSHLYNVDEMG
jgi:hypothetical protein